MRLAKLFLPPALDGLNVVLLNCYTADRQQVSVVPGEFVGGLNATNHLIRHGHRRIGLINGEPWMDASADRLAGYRQALASADIAFDAGDQSHLFRRDRRSQSKLMARQQPIGVTVEDIDRLETGLQGIGSSPNFAACHGGTLDGTFVMNRAIGTFRRNRHRRGPRANPFCTNVCSWHTAGWALGGWPTGATPVPLSVLQSCRHLIPWQMVDCIPRRRRPQPPPWTYV